MLAHASPNEINEEGYALQRTAQKEEFDIVTSDRFKLITAQQIRKEIVQNLVLLENLF